MNWVALLALLGLLAAARPAVATCAGDDLAHKGHCCCPDRAAAADPTARELVPACCCKLTSPAAASALPTTTLARALAWPTAPTSVSWLAAPRRATRAARGDLVARAHAPPTLLALGTSLRV